MWKQKHTYQEIRLPCYRQGEAVFQSFSTFEGVAICALWFSGINHNTAIPASGRVCWLKIPSLQNIAWLFLSEDELEGMQLSISISKMII